MHTGPADRSVLRLLAGKSGASVRGRADSRRDCLQERWFALLRYVVVGAFATLVHYVVLAIAVDLLRWPPVGGTVSGALVGALVAYVGHRHVSFRSGRAHQLALPRFFLVVSLGVCSNGAIVWVGTVVAGLHYWIPQLIATSVTVLLTFSLHRAWTFPTDTRVGARSTHVVRPAPSLR